MSWEALERRYARDPLVTDDDVHGYNTRWEWLNTSTGERFQCNSATTGAAIWVVSTPSGGVKPLTGVATPVSETKASLTIQSALKLEAKPLGILGNYITVKAVSSGVAGMSISNLTGTGTALDPYIVEIKLGTTTTNNTMTLIGAALTAKTDVAAVINNTVITGATQMTAFAVAPLTGGLNGTAGYDLQVVKDTNGNRWELKHIVSGCYYWSPDGFPNVNTEYVDRVESGVVIWKYRFNYGALPNATTTTKTHTITSMASIIDWNYIVRLISTKLSTLNGISTTTIADQIAVSLSGTGATIRTAIDRTAYEAYFNLFYTKT